MKLAESNPFARAFEAHSVAMLLVDPEGGTIVHANPAAAALYGYPRETLQRMSVVELNLLDPKLVQQNIETARHRKANVLVLRQRRADGAIRIMRVSVSPVSVGRKELLFSIVQDITTEREADLAVMEANARFKRLFEGHAAIMLLIDPTTGKLLDANHAAARFYGRTREELCQLNIGDINGLDTGTVHDHMQLVALRERNTFLRRHRLADGTCRTVEVNTTVVEVLGEPQIFSIILDVTEREEARAALQRERQRYHSFMAIARDGIHILDAEGTLIEANPAFLEMIGETEDAVGRARVSDWDVGLPLEQLAMRTRELTTHPDRFETQYRRTDGTTYDVEVQATAIELDGVRYQLASARDATARKQAERALAAKQTELEEMNRSLEERVSAAVDDLRARDHMMHTQNRHAAMGEMIANIAHQWRQPLHTLGMLIANLRDAAKFGELDTAALETAAERANRLVQKMSSTINDFRDFLRPDKEPREFSILEQVRDAVGLLEASLTHAGIAVEIVAPADVTAFGVANEYSQVLVNLLTNARQVIQARGVMPGRVVLSLDDRGEVGCLTVHDNGGGVPDAVIDRIFDPYFSTCEGGTGLGLYMSRGLVEQNLRGRLEVANVADGASFSIFTPRARPVAGEQPKIRSLSPAALQRARKPHT